MNLFLLIKLSCLSIIGATFGTMVGGKLIEKFSNKNSEYLLQKMGLSLLIGMIGFPILYLNKEKIYYLLQLKNQRYFMA